MTHYNSFDALALFGIATVGLDTGKNPSRIMGNEVSGNYFDALEIQPYLGRFFHDADEHGPNSAPYLVLGYAHWHSRFQDDPSVVGRVVQIDKHPFTILGVAPPSFQGTLLFFSPDFWAPIVNHEQYTDRKILDVRNEQDFIVAVGHLKAGVTPEVAVGDLNRVGSWLEKTMAHDASTPVAPWRARACNAALCPQAAQAHYIRHSRTPCSTQLRSLNELFPLRCFSSVIKTATLGRPASLKVHK